MVTGMGRSFVRSKNVSSLLQFHLKCIFLKLMLCVFEAQSKEHAIFWLIYKKVVFFVAFESHFNLQICKHILNH